MLMLRVSCFLQWRGLVLKHRALRAWGRAKRKEDSLKVSHPSFPLHSACSFFWSVLLFFLLILACPWWQLRIAGMVFRKAVHRDALERLREDEKDRFSVAPLVEPIDGPPARKSVCMQLLQAMYSVHTGQLQTPQQLQEISNVRSCLFLVLAENSKCGEWLLLFFT